MATERGMQTRVAEPESPVYLRVEGISKQFRDFKALDNINFHIRKGEVLGFLGPNGAGKTTAMRILSGYFPPSSGKVFVGDEDLFKTPQKVKRRIGYLPESVNVYGNMKVSEYLKFVCKIKDVPRKKREEEFKHKVSECGLWDVKDRLIRFLSKGYKQRLGLAQALIGNPDVLLLDEPTSGLDPKQIIEIRTLIRNLGRERTLILSTHILPEVSMVCDRVLILNQGRVVAAGTTDELQAELQACHELFLVLGDRHRKAEILKILGAVSGVERVKVQEESADRLHLSLMIVKGTELRPQITQLLVEHKIPLLEMRSGRLSLEDIFMKLVVDESGILN